jgi:tetratricopeptide (TPR) repeat protein
VDNRDEDQDERTTDARLARIHLRTGSYGLARAELESIAGAGTLDGEALADLAEVRWRTGDLPGAGEAAQAYLATGREAAAPLAIAAEAAAALGRPGEARRLATRALAATGGSIDEVFLGIARSPIWPGDERRAEPAAELFPGAMSPSGDTDRRPPGAPAGGAVGAATAGGAGRARRTVGGGAVRTGAPGLPPWAVTFAAASEVAGGSSPADAGAGVGGPTEPRVSDAAFASGAAAGLWDGHPIPDAAEPLPDPAAELAAARAAIAADDHDGAALHLALALRLDPSTAPAVLDAAGHHRSAALEMVKGDALRLVGHDVEARRAYAAAARSMAKHTEQRRQ